MSWIFAAALMVLTSNGRAQASERTPARPAGAQAIVIDSPAWAELMALPLLPGDALPFYAAALVETWGRAVEGHQLRRALLHLHLRLAAGEALPAGWRVADVWQLSRNPGLSEVALMDAHHLALNRSLSFEPIDRLPAGRAGGGLRPVGPAAPGFWADAQGRTLAAHLMLRNAAALSLAPSSLSLRLVWPGKDLLLDCEAVGPTAVLAPQQPAAWWCVATDPPGHAVQALKQLPQPHVEQQSSTLRVEWQSSALRSPASVRQMADALAGRPPPTLAAFVARNSICIAQGSCAAPQPLLRSASDVMAEKNREAAAELQDVKDRRSAERVFLLAFFGYFLAGVTLHVLVARLVGTLLAFTISLAQGPALAYWLVTTDRLTISSLGELVLVLFVVCSGVYLAPLGHAIYKRFFANL